VQGWIEMSWGTTGADCRQLTRGEMADGVGLPQFIEFNELRCLTAQNCSIDYHSFLGVMANHHGAI